MLSLGQGLSPFFLRLSRLKLLSLLFSGAIGDDMDDGGSNCLVAFVGGKKGAAGDLLFQPLFYSRHNNGTICFTVHEGYTSTYCAEMQLGPRNKDCSRFNEEGDPEYFTVCVSQIEHVLASKAIWQD
ncbi:unnamed protein product [Dovyalis caffra]|uniref:Uncharacterized protein n=1 Tax=Dovyalis caffra TaxID=77055 RepID=A0AAV1SCV6_9ROSI|nr:unnamed protein product [Dovyalis caffra]